MLSVRPPELRQSEFLFTGLSEAFLAFVSRLRRNTCLAALSTNYVNKRKRRPSPILLPYLLLNLGGKNFSNFPLFIVNYARFNIWPFYWLVFCLCVVCLFSA